MPQNTLGSGDILAAEHPNRRFAIRGSGFQHNRKKLYLSNLKFARAAWGPLSSAARKGLERLTKSLRLSVEVGDILFLDGRWYVTHSGLLRIAQRRRCVGISSFLLREFSESSLNHWVFKAIVYTTAKSKGFAGYGDADPDNVSSLVRGSELRIAETRAVNRALRKAYGIGLCSVEELGAFSGSSKPSSIPAKTNISYGSNGSNNGQPRLRDKLCLLIREYNLDPNLVKAYAADFCGTETLSGASRDLVESFITQLAKSAKENRDSLICKLNSYAQVPEVAS